jgi:hypothetical protein
MYSVVVSGSGDGAVAASGDDAAAAEKAQWDDDDDEDRDVVAVDAADADAGGEAKAAPPCCSAESPALAAAGGSSSRLHGRRADRSSAARPKSMVGRTLCRKTSSFGASSQNAEATSPLARKARLEEVGVGAREVKTCAKEEGGTGVVRRQGERERAPPRGVVVVPPHRRSPTPAASRQHYKTRGPSLLPITNSFSTTSCNCTS